MFTLKCLQDGEDDHPTRPATAKSATDSEQRHAPSREPLAGLAKLAVATPPSGACGSCLHFRPAPGKQPDGWCTRHKVETWAQYAGGCADDWTPADSAARELERRRTDVVARLKADPELRYSFDVANASPTAPADGPVSVMLGLRTATGTITTGEARIPANRWPGVALFGERLRMAAEALPS